MTFSFIGLLEGVRSVQCTININRKVY